MISGLFKKDIVRVLTFFLISPGSRHNRKEVKEKTEMNNVPLDNVLNKLLSLRILEEKDNLLFLNIESEKFDIIANYIKEEYKIFDLPHKIFNIVVQISNKLNEMKYIKNSYLFGSYAKLIYNEKSDIDIAVIFYNKIKNKKNIERKINNEIKKISKKNNKTIEIHFFLEKDMKEKDPLIKDILRNGKRII